MNEKKEQRARELLKKVGYVNGPIQLEDIAKVFHAKNMVKKRLLGLPNLYEKKK